VARLPTSAGTPQASWVSSARKEKTNIHYHNNRGKGEKKNHNHHDIQANKLADEVPSEEVLTL